MPNGAGPAVHVDAIVAVGDADPAIGEAPEDLPERQRDHHEADAGRAQRQHREDAPSRRASTTSAPAIAARWPQPARSRQPAA